MGCTRTAAIDQYGGQAAHALCAQPNLPNTGMALLTIALLACALLVVGGFVRLFSR